MDARGEVKDPVTTASGDDCKTIDEALVAKSTPPILLTSPSKPLPRACHKTLYAFYDSLEKIPEI